jgi:hypothetical protein
MKKILFLAILSIISMATAIAITPQFFAFEIGNGAAYDIDSGDVVTSNGMGFTYSFSNDFKGGFNFVEINSVSIDTINISIVPMENVTLSMYSGQITGINSVTSVETKNLGFGIGLGYDFFTNNKSLFTSLGMYLDWYASGSTVDGDPYALNNGGVISMGLKTRIGI